MKNILVIFAVLFSVSFANADHSMQDVLDWTQGQSGNNLYQAVHNLKKAVNVDTVCDFKNSIQIPVPQAADTINTWRQIVLCFPSQEALESAHQWLEEQPLKSYNMASTYGLNVSNVMDVTYDKSGDTQVKLISISFK